MQKQELAKVVATFMHSLQTYGDGHPYETHLEGVVNILKEFNISDDDILAAAWLHDIVEDTPASISQVKKVFGDRIASLVYAVTNERGLNRKERNLKTYPKMLDCPEAIQIKLADRICNVRNSIDNSQTTKFYGMYKSEYPAFRGILYKPGQYEIMWKALDDLFNYKDYGLN